MRVIIFQILVVVSVFKIIGCQDDVAERAIRREQNDTSVQTPAFPLLQERVEKLVSDNTVRDARQRELALDRLYDIFETRNDLSLFVFGGWGSRIESGDPDKKSAEVYSNLVVAVAYWLGTNQHNKASVLLYGITGIPPVYNTREEFMNTWEMSNRFKVIQKLLYLPSGKGQ